jgi:hypothetical protein
MDPQSLADQLITAERERTAIPAFTSTFPFLGIKRVYLAEELVVRHLASTRPPVGLNDRVGRLAMLVYTAGSAAQSARRTVGGCVPGSGRRRVLPY